VKYFGTLSSIVMANTNESASLLQNIDCFTYPRLDLLREPFNVLCAACLFALQKTLLVLLRVVGVRDAPVNQMQIAAHELSPLYK
jgi:hypothetical protein